MQWDPKCSGCDGAPSVTQRLAEHLTEEVGMILMLQCVVLSAEGKPVVLREKCSCASRGGCDSEAVCMNSEAKLSKNLAQSLRTLENSLKSCSQ